MQSVFEFGSIERRVCWISDFCVGHGRGRKSLCWISNVCIGQGRAKKRLCWIGDVCVEYGRSTFLPRVHLETFLAQEILQCSGNSSFSPQVEGRKESSIEL